jgi:hypothetical protein
MPVVENVSSEKRFGLFYVYQRDLEESTAVHRKEETSGYVTAVIIGTSPLAHSVLIKVVSVR